MKVEKRSWLFLIGGFLAFLGGFVIGGAQFKNGLHREHKKRAGGK
jgi:hypothetical protein